MPPVEPDQQGAHKQQRLLQSVINATVDAESDARPALSIEEARHEQTVYEYDSTRQAVRILFISTDESLLNQTTQSLDGFLQLGDVFDEVHILILRTGIASSTPVLRVSDTVWLYTATADDWWWTPVTGVELVRNQLEFAGGFRPDLIVALDEYQSAMTAWYLGRQYDRPTQVHVHDNFLSRATIRRLPHGWWQALMARFAVKRFLSIRTTSSQLKDVLEKRYPRIPDIATLPRFNNYEAEKNSPATVQLKVRYPQFVFTILCLGRLDDEVSMLLAIEGAARALMNPRVGLVVVGPGTLSPKVAAVVAARGIAQQVVFEGRTPDLLSYFKTTDVLLVTDTDALSDELVLRAAAIGVPLVATVTPLRESVFVSGESILLAEPNNALDLSRHISALLNDFNLRRALARAAPEAVETQFATDPELYRAEYRASIESAIFAGEDSETESGEAASAPAGGEDSAELSSESIPDTASAVPESRA